MRPLMVTALALAALVPVAPAQAWQVGDSATCYGMAGPIIRIDQRPGWDVPWAIAKSGTNELRCTSDQLRAANAAPEQTPGRPSRRVKLGFALDTWGKRRNRALVMFCLFTDSTKTGGHPIAPDVLAPHRHKVARVTT